MPRESPLLSSVFPRYPILTLSVALVVGWAIAGDVVPAGVSGEQLPTHYIYHGQDVDLPLDHERVAVSYRADTTASERAANAAGVGVPLSTSKPTGLDRWHLLRPETPFAHTADASARIAKLLGAPQVEFSDDIR